MCRVWYVWVGVCVGGVAVYVLGVFLTKVEGEGEECFPISLVMAMRSVVRIFVRSSKARAFSLDTR